MQALLKRTLSLTVVVASLVAHLGSAPVAAGAGPAAPGAAIFVTTTADELNQDGDCSLREAVRAANLNARVDACAAGRGVDTINLRAGIYRLTRAGNDNTAAAGDLDLNSSLTIIGRGAGATFIDGNRIDRIFQIIAGVTVRLRDLTVRRGALPYSGTLALDGGAIYSAGTLFLVNTTVRNSRAYGRGGGIYNVGVLQLTNSYVIGNWSGLGGGGGGIYNGGQGAVTLLLSTLRANISAENGGGGIFNDVGATLTLNNSTVRGNSNNKGSPGAGILNRGLLTLSGSAVFDNLTSGDGLGLYNAGFATVVNSTLSSAGGSIVNGTDNDGQEPESGTLRLNNSTVDAVSNGNGSVTLRNTILEMCGGPINSQGYNLIQDAAGCTITGITTGNLLGVDPGLGPLQNNGGPTQTRALLSGSPALDAANPSPPGSGGGACAEKDQRAVVRPRNGDAAGTARCDMGAYERQPTE